MIDRKIGKASLREINNITLLKSNHFVFLAYYYKTIVI